MSRNGCRRCRTRRVKANNENGPGGTKDAATRTVSESGQPAMSQPTTVAVPGRPQLFALRPHSGIGVGATTISAAVRWGRREPLCPSPDPPLGGEPRQSPKAHDAYFGTVQRLQRTQTAILTNDDSAAPTSTNTTIKDHKPYPLSLFCRGMLSFLYLVPPLFLDLVERREPWALVVLVHFWVLAMYVVALWWVGNTPGREVRAIWGVLPRGRRGLIRGGVGCGGWGKVSSGR
ncbi:hypothetical protein PG987_007389 [Apiospora arundinis]